MKYKMKYRVCYTIVGYASRINASDDYSYLWFARMMCWIKKYQMGIENVRVAIICEYGD